MEKPNEEKRHTLALGARSHAEIAGVREVLSFDEHCVVLVTDCGEMTVEGEGLRVGVLDIARGAVALDGRVDGVFYADVAAKPRARKRFFS